MPVTIKWYCEGLVLYVEFVGDISSADTIAYSQTIQQFVASSDAPLVHMITSVTSIASYPPLRETMKTIKFPPRIGWSVVIGLTGNAMVRFMAQVVSSAMQLRFREVNNLDQALDFLQARDSTLPNLQVFRHIVESADTMA